MANEDFDMDGLQDIVARLDPEQLEEFIDQLPPEAVTAIVEEMGMKHAATQVPATPIKMARELVPGFISRPHLRYLSKRITAAMKEVEQGGNPRIIVEMPPRSGKSLLATQITSAWALALHPNWPIMLTSYSSSLATSWSRTVRRWVAEGKVGDVELSQDSTRAEEWETTEGGTLLARSLGGQTTGRGAKLLVIDDPHKDFADAHSQASRDAVWNWWLSTSSARLTPQSIVIVIMTRWHTDDLVGRLLSREYPGDPSDWEVIRLSAIAEKNDVLGREPGTPLLSPLDLNESIEMASKRWNRVKNDVGSYVWSALYQQNPAPAEGTTLKVDWFRYWTTDPDLVEKDEFGDPKENGKTVLLDPDKLGTAEWTDSWDLTFKGSDTSDYVVGQRWAKVGANRYLIAQQRGRWGFSEVLRRMRDWAKRDDPAVSPYGHYVYQRIVERAANAEAAQDTLKNEIAGIKLVSARTSKENRARAVSPEIESGNVLLPHPAEPGMSWVGDMIAEIREFPNGAHDDQVDTMTQALAHLRDGGMTGIVMPGETSVQVPDTAPQRSRRQAVPGLSIPGGTLGGSSRLAAARSSGRRV